MSLSTIITVGLRAIASKTVGPATVRDSLPLLDQTVLDSGTGLNQADQMYHASGALGTSTTLTLDVNSGVATDGFGDAFSIARVKALYVHNTGTVTLNLGGTNGATGGGTIPVGAGGSVLIFTPDATAYVATNSSADSITLANPSGSTAGAYVLVVIGATA